MQPRPSAPPMEVFKDEDIFCNYNCERGCDIEFLVGPEDGDQMRIPVHSSKLQRYPVFKAMLSNNFHVNVEGCGGNLRRYTVHDVDGKAFDNLMKFLYAERINLSSYEMAIETLKAAHLYLIPELVRECVIRLQTLITCSSVMYIFAHVRFLCNDVEHLEKVILAAEGEKKTYLPKRRNFCSEEHDQDPAGLEIKELCLWLLCRTLIFIDTNAKLILDGDEFENLQKDYVHLILKRDSLDCSEIVVFSALVRWAETECKRQHLPLTHSSKRQVLHDLLFVVRYFQMTLVEFNCGPATSGILSPMEIELIKNELIHGVLFPIVKRRPSMNCCPTATQIQRQIRQSLEEGSTKSNEFKIILRNYKYMSRPRTPLNPLMKGKATREEKLENRRKSKTSMKIKTVGLVVKRFCLPCTGNDGRQGSHDDNNMKALRPQVSTQRGIRRKRSFLSKCIGFTVQAFAFFFD